MRSFVPQIYFLYLFIIASNVLESIFGEPRPSAISDDTVHFLLSNGLMAFTLIVVYPKYKRVSQLLLNHKLLLGIYLLATISCCWSPDPLASFRLVFLPLVLLVGSAYISLTFTPEQILDLTAKATSLFAVGSILGQLFLSSIEGTVLQGWTGIYGHRNYLGDGMVIGIAALLARRSKWGFRRACMFLLVLLLLLLSQSATAIVSAATVFAVVLFMKLPRFVRLALPVAAAVAIVMVVWTSSVDLALQQLFKFVGRDSTFTGRNVTWYWVLERIADRPILGYGFRGFWAPHKDIIIGALGWNPGHAHNGFLDIILTLGLVGLIMLLAILWDGVACGWRVRARCSEFAGTWLLLVIWLEFLNNLTGVDYMVPTAPLWTVFTIAYFSCSLVESKRIAFRAQSVKPVGLSLDTLLRNE